MRRFSLHSLRAIHAGDKESIETFVMDQYYRCSELVYWHLEDRGFPHDDDLVLKIISKACSNFIIWMQRLDLCKLDPTVCKERWLKELVRELLEMIPAGA